MLSPVLFFSLHFRTTRRQFCLGHVFFCHIDVPKIDLEQAVELKNDMSLEEVSQAITSMQSGESPGPDGFPSEFFKKFSELLAPLLLSAFKESFFSNSLPPTKREDIISLILKKDKNRLHCS